MHSWVSECVRACVCLCSRAFEPQQVCLSSKIVAFILFRYIIFFFLFKLSHSLSRSLSLDPLFCFCLFYSIIHRVENYILLNHLYGIIHEAATVAVATTAAAAAAITVATAMDIGYGYEVFRSMSTWSVYNEFIMGNWLLLLCERENETNRVRYILRFFLQVSFNFLSERTKNRIIEILLKENSNNSMDFDWFLMPLFIVGCVCACVCEYGSNSIFG